MSCNCVPLGIERCPPFISHAWFCNRYAHLFGSDDRMHACMSELGVSLTRELGFHQVRNCLLLSYRDIDILAQVTILMCVEVAPFAINNLSWPRPPSSPDLCMARRHIRDTLRGMNHEFCGSNCRWTSRGMRSAC